MPTSDIVFLTVAAVFTSTLTAFVGAGGGTVLIAVMLFFMPPAAAIPVHGVVHLVSNAWRSWLFRRHMAWPLIWRFSLLMPAGVMLGLWLFQGMSKEAVQFLIGLFVLISLFARQIGRLRDNDLPLWAFVPLGFVTGTLNMIVGVIAPILGALIIRRDLGKEAIVGTLGFFGLVGNLLKVAGFTAIGFSLIEYAPAILAMIPAMLFGTWLGKVILGRVSESFFLMAYKAMLIMLAGKLILWDGLMTLARAG